MGANWLAFDVCRALDEADCDSADFRHAVHERTDGGAHALVTVQPSQQWHGMPRDVVRTAISQHLTRWQAALIEAGYGVAPWTRGELLCALIVAADQASADAQAPDVCQYLDDHPGVLV